MIIVDCEEPNDIISKIPNKKIEKLYAGDYIVNDLLIERKSLIDFYNSVVSNRLWRQLDRMKNLDEFQSCLAITGDLFGNVGHNGSSFIINAFKTVIQFYKIPIVQFTDIDEFVNFLNICDREEKEKGDLYKEQNIDDRKIISIAMIDGMDLRISQNLLDYFSTIKNIAMAGKKKLKKVKDVGPKLASNIFDFFN